MTKDKNKKLPLVVLFGRTNVGKSTILNRLASKHRAIVSSVSGTTRDSNFAVIDWQGKSFELIDLAGPDFYSDKNKHLQEINDKLKQQINMYLDKADLILFTTDNRSGLMPQDQELAKAILKNNKLKNKVKLLVNKVDNFKHASESASFYKLNLGEPILISATTGAGTGDLLEFIVKEIKAPEKDEAVEIRENIKICILGKPNVGKSSLLNKILGYERVVVSEMPHTTREPQDTTIEYKKNYLTIADTAGITKKIKNLDSLGKSSIKKSLAVMRRSDIVLLVIEGADSLTQQESKLVQEIVEHQKSLIIVSNKWDLLKEKDTKLETENIYSHLPFITWAPVHFISCLPVKTPISKSKSSSDELINEEFISKRIKNLLDLILEVYQGRKKEIKTEELYQLLLKIVRMHPPTKAKGYKRPHIKTLSQTRVSPPVFQVVIGPNDTLNETYLRFIKNKLRDFYGFVGTPIEINLHKKKGLDK
ncbi:MAG: ribosome biogenesis GTPase Der [Candidatus Pacebacteria bacterium]|nr:ribosome biogenesis GTPase Der [Candidatus Paceibacterota bacterium]